MKRDGRGWLLRSGNIALQPKKVGGAGGAGASTPKGVPHDGKQVIV